MNTSIQNTRRFNKIYLKSKLIAMVIYLNRQSIEERRNKCHSSKAPATLISIILNSQYNSSSHISKWAKYPKLYRYCLFKSSPLVTGLQECCTTRSYVIVEILLLIKKEKEDCTRMLQSKEGFICLCAKPAYGRYIAKVYY